MRNAHEWFEHNSGWAPPDEDTLAEWLADDVCRCPDECLVAPGSWCDHGLASWWLILGALPGGLGNSVAGMTFGMDTDERSTTVDVDERGFEGRLIIEDVDGDRHVRVSGTRPQDGANVVKDVPASRDEELTELVSLLVGGDETVAPRLLAHLGVLDPPLPE